MHTRLPALLLNLLAVFTATSAHAYSEPWIPGTSSTHVGAFTGVTPRDRIGGYQLASLLTEADLELQLGGSTRANGLSITAHASGSGLFQQRDPMGFADSVNLYAGFGWDPVNRRDPTGMLPPDLPPLLELGTEGRAAQQECQLGIGEGAWGTIMGIAKGLYSLKDPLDLADALSNNAEAAASAAYNKEGGGFSGVLYGAVAFVGSILPDIGGSYYRATIAGDPRTRCREATTMMIGGAEVAAGAYGALSVGRGIARSGAAVGRTPTAGAPLTGEAGALSVADEAGAVGVAEESVVLYHGSQNFVGESFELRRAIEGQRAGTPEAGIYLTDDFRRAASGYGRGGHIVRTEVPKSFADRIRQEGGPGGNQTEYFVNTAEGVHELNRSTRKLSTPEAIRAWLAGLF